MQSASAAGNYCGGAEVSQKLKLEALCDSAALPWAYTRRTSHYREAYTLMLTAGPFTVARKWSQPTCPSVGEWIQDLWGVYVLDGILFSCKKIRFADMDRSGNDCRGK